MHIYINGCGITQDALRIMRNPESRYEKTFEYGGVVGLRAFSNRKQEIADLIRVFENGTC